MKKCFNDTFAVCLDMVMSEKHTFCLETFWLYFRGVYVLSVRILHSVPVSASVPPGHLTLFPHSKEQQAGITAVCKVWCRCDECERGRLFVSLCGSLINWAALPGCSSALVRPGLAAASLPLVVLESLCDKIVGKIQRMEVWGEKKSLLLRQTAELSSLKLVSVSQLMQSFASSDVNRLHELKPFLVCLIPSTFQLFHVKERH